jgi:hypothetical protein
MTLNQLTWKLTALLALAAVPVLADTGFQVRRMTRDDVPFGKGQCDIRLQVDNEVVVTVRGDSVRIRTLNGQEPRDDGSECNQPLPQTMPRNFTFEVKESRNDIRMEEQPSPRNGFSAVVRIRDSSGGFGRYHFRLSWDLAGTAGMPNQSQRDDRPGSGRGGFDRPGGRDGGRDEFIWNNAVNYRGRGRGQSTLAGWGTQQLGDVSLDIDRGGRVTLTFRTDTGRPLNLSGTVMGREGNRWKADVSTVDSSLRLRGPLYFALDGRQNVGQVALEATDGRERLTLNWDRF